MAAEQSKSLKNIFQGMVRGYAELMQGTVISVSPLKIQMANDEKLIINERITVVPRHLSDYKTKATYTVDEGVLDSETFEDGEHGDVHTDERHDNRFQRLKGWGSRLCAVAE